MLYFIPTPIGNIEDISHRSLRLLCESEVVLCEDTRVAKKLLMLLQDRYQCKNIKKEFISLHSHNEKEKILSFKKDLFEKNVVYLSDAGMPCISDPGCFLVQYCQENSIKYDVLPGPSAFSVAYASSGFCQNEFLFFGFLPHKGSIRLNKLNELMFSGYVGILYESPHRLLKLLEQICNIDENREIFLAKEITKKYQQFFKDKAINIFNSFKNKDIRGEWVVVINSSKKEIKTLTFDDIKDLNIPKKQMAKLLSKLTGKSAKECYNDLL